ncbi:alpha-1,2-fucosyltransferase [Candidatus Saccharibacteria bacterium]|nr:alpha-1,2-fucosyltransferase [Candidatus Saccharibacteria bacterium]
MLSKVVMGRLGNQMFQYAAMRAIQERLYPNETVNLIFSQIERNGSKEDGFVNQLDVFNINTEKVVYDQKLKLTLHQNILVLWYFLRRKMIKIFSKSEDYEDKKRKFEIKVQDKYNRNGLYLFSYGYYDFKKTNKEDKLFIGFFESQKFFNDIRETIIEEFTPKEPPLEKNKNMYRKIMSSESICVSVRRGDFLKDRFKDSTYVCTPEYFSKAIDLVKRKVKNPRFVVFSDDIDWVRKEMDFPKDTIYETGDDPLWEKIRLMYSCKHFIISNSTFSWWAQYLSRNDEKIVVAPSVWRKTGYGGDDLYDNRWYLVKA